MHISITKGMRVLKGDLSTLSSLDSRCYFKHNKPGQLSACLSERIISKYGLLDDYNFEPATLIFLRSLSDELRQDGELRILVEQTLQLLLLWNQRFEFTNQIVCQQNIYFNNLRNEIELSLAHINRISPSKGHQLRKLYSSERLEENLNICKTLISELKPSGEAAGSITFALDKQSSQNFNTRLYLLGSKAPIAVKSLELISKNIINASYIPGNRELFYSSVREQMTQYIIKNQLIDSNKPENAWFHTAGGELSHRQQPGDSDIPLPSHLITPLSFRELLPGMTTTSAFRQHFRSRGNRNDVREAIRGFINSNYYSAGFRDIGYNPQNREALRNIGTIANNNYNFAGEYEPGAAGLANYIKHPERPLLLASGPISVLLQEYIERAERSLSLMSGRPAPLPGKLLFKTELPSLTAHAASKPLEQIIASVIKTSHMLGNRELFYSSVREQLTQYIIKNQLIDSNELENVWFYTAGGELSHRQQPSDSDIPLPSHLIMPVSFRELLPGMTTTSAFRQHFFSQGNRKDVRKAIREFINSNYYSSGFRDIGYSPKIREALRNIGTIANNNYNFARENEPGAAGLANYIKLTERPLLLASGPISVLLQEYIERAGRSLSLMSGRPASLPGELLFKTELPSLTAHAASKPLEQIIASVIKTSHMLGNRELFYSSVREQLTQYIIKNQLIDSNKPENAWFYTSGGELSHRQQAGDGRALSAGVINNIAAENNALLRSYHRYIKGSSDLNDLLKTIENKYYRNREYEIYGDSLSLNKHISYKQLLPRNELEGEIDKYKTDISRQIDKAFKNIREISHKTRVALPIEIKASTRITPIDKKYRRPYKETERLFTSAVSRISAEQLLAKFAEGSGQKTPSAPPAREFPPIWGQPYSGRLGQLRKIAGKDAPLAGQAAFHRRSIQQAGDRNIRYMQNVYNMLLNRVKNRLSIKPDSPASESRQTSFTPYLIKKDRINLAARHSNYYATNDKSDYNSLINKHTDITVAMVHSPERTQGREAQSFALPPPSPGELINRFGNLIADPNVPSADLIARNADSILGLNVADKSLGIPGLIKKLSSGEEHSKVERQQVLEITQKLKEQEDIINNLNRAYNQLQEDMASRADEKKIMSMIMKEFRAKLKLDKMRYGIQ